MPGAFFATNDSLFGPPYGFTKLSCKNTHKLNII